MRPQEPRPSHAFGRSDWRTDAEPMVNPENHKYAGDERYLTWWDIMSDLDPEWVGWSERLVDEDDGDERRVA